MLEPEPESESESPLSSPKHPNGSPPAPAPPPPLDDDTHDDHTHSHNGAAPAPVSSPPRPSTGSDPDRGRIEDLEQELHRTRGEKEALEAQYTSLLGKLTAMRVTVGDKLKQDAEELDRREQEISDLRAANEDLAATVDTLKSELEQTNDDADHVHTELEQLRLRAFDSQRQTSDEATSREMALRDAQEDLERVRTEREEWEGEAMRERVKREELATRVGHLESQLAVVKTERELMREERDREAESASNLLAVLEEFQAAKDRELKTTLGELQAQLRSANESLADFKERATRAEFKWTAAQNDSERVLSLTKDVKDKTLLIGKLRHEAIILNEHLTEALRRLKKDSGESSVDRQLVSNVLITFLNTPRADTKRFEMLQLISSILSWSDDQREQVGLQRSSGLLSAPGVISSGPRHGKGHSRSAKGKAPDDSITDNESFGQLWVEFLLKESNAAAASAKTSAANRPPASDRSGTSASGSAPSTPRGTGSQSPRFSSSDLPPMPSPPLMSPSPTGPGSRRPSYPFVAPGAGTPPTIVEEK